ncbi:MAG TPA: LysM peptidoglycan-binding domain-containing protein [Gryllotalpicola sp.]
MSSITVQVSGAGRAVGMPPAAVRSRLRLTRRGRAVLAALVAAPLVAVALWFGVNSGLAAASGESGAPAASFTHVTVTAGESLWQIAETIAPHSDPRDVISAIVDLNGLEGTTVTPGQTLAVPPQYAK